MVSVGYLIFLGFSTLLYYLIPGKYQKYLLIMASMVFIGSISIPFLIFALIFTCVNYFFGLLIDKQKKKSLRKVFYFIAISTDIGALIFYKYIDFIIDNLNIIASISPQLSTFSTLNILIPIGISYYTFQSIGYLYRVYHNMETPEKRLGDFAIYILFFPKFLAGPIEKSNHFLQQVRNNVVFKQENITNGLRLVLLGFFKKIVIGDNIGILINSLYGDIYSHDSRIFIVVLLLQPLYVYFDFSGYTDIALGSGRLLGYKLTENFNRPFFATNVSSFWRRWHISLTSWCNEFIFKPVLYKRRKWKDWGAVYAVFLTFLIIGVWHGSRWNFVLLGLFQGIAISYEYLTRRKRLEIAKKFSKNLVIWFSRIITYLFISFSLIFFYAPKFSDALFFLKRLIINNHKISFDFPQIEMFNFVGAVVFALLFLWFENREEKGHDVLFKFNTVQAWKRWVVYYVMIFLIFSLSLGSNAFVYEQF